MSNSDTKDTQPPSTLRSSEFAKKGSEKDLATEKQNDPHSSKAHEALTLVFPGFTEESGDRYAIVPLIETYEEAQSVAVEIFGSDMIQPAPENVILRGSAKNREGNFVWADIRPKDWKGMSRMSGQIAVIEKGRQERLEMLEDSQRTVFLHGYLLLTAGRMERGKTVWTKLEQQGRSSAMINRPKTLAEAIVVIREAIWSHLFLANQFGKEHTWPRDPTSLDDVNESTLKFCTFTSDTNTNVWQKFPESAYHDDAAWRKVVPPPRGILGITLEKLND